MAPTRCGAIERVSNPSVCPRREPTPPLALSIGDAAKMLGNGAAVLVEVANALAHLAYEAAAVEVVSLGRPGAHERAVAPSSAGLTHGVETFEGPSQAGVQPAAATVARSEVQDPRMRTRARLRASERRLDPEKATAWVSADDVRALLGCSRAAAYRHLRAAAGRHRGSGKLLRVPLAAWERYAGDTFAP